MEKKISVIVPVYNVEQYLERCIKSIINQIYENLEIVLVDDGSKDRSGEMCDSFAEKDERIKVIHKKNGGLSDARNVGLDVASGEYVLFVDSDDYIEKGIFEKLKTEMSEGVDCIVFQHDLNGNADIVSLPLKSGYTYGGEELLEALFKGNRQFMPVWKYLYKKRFLEENNLRFVTDLIHEDEIWTPIVLLKASKCRFCDYVGYHYIIRQGSIMTSKSVNKMDSYIDVAVELEKQLNKQQINSKWLKKRMSKQIAALYIMSAKQIIDTKQKETYNKLREHLYLNKYATTFKQEIAFVYIRSILFWKKLLKRKFM